MLNDWEVKQESIPAFGGHVPAVHKNCEKFSCAICEGGLFLCSNCGLGEGCLTSECPGSQQSFETSKEVYAGRLDFRDNRWVEEISPYSPGSCR